MLIASGKILKWRGLLRNRELNLSKHKCVSVNLKWGEIY